MALKIKNNFQLEKKLPDFERQLFQTLQEMREFKETRLPAIYIASCVEDGNVYIYNEKNELDERTGRWRVLRADAALSEDVTANVAAGAIKSGSKFPAGTSLTDFVKKLLTAEINPTISLDAPGSGLRLYGSALDSVTFTGKITGAGTATITRIEFYIDGVRQDFQDFEAGKTSYTYTKTTGVSASTNVQLRAYYTQASGAGGYVSAQKSYTFVHPSYFGTTPLAPADMDSNEILKGTKLTLASKSYTATGITMTNQRIFFAYPAAFGEIGSIKDANNFEYKGSYTQRQLPLPSAGQTPQYYVYIMTDPVTVDGFRQQFN